MLRPVLGELIERIVPPRPGRRVQSVTVTITWTLLGEALHTVAMVTTAIFAA